jgi:hypothetical protein
MRGCAKKSPSRLRELISLALGRSRSMPIVVVFVTILYWGWLGLLLTE